MRGIPERWEDYEPFNQVMQRTPFLAVKVPLKESYLMQMPKATRFTPERLIHQCHSRGIKLGLIVDLTFTTRYYDPQEFTQKDIGYKKIFVEGHNVPNSESVSQFKAVINKFRESAPDSVVAVHCTHGVNRTGYMICRYLIDEESWDPDAAIAAFGEARGFPIERENYLADLRTAKSPVKDATAVQGEMESSANKCDTTPASQESLPCADTVSTSKLPSPKASEKGRNSQESHRERYSQQHVYHGRHQQRYPQQSYYHHDNGADGWNRDDRRMRSQQRYAPYSEHNQRQNQRNQRQWPQQSQHQWHHQTWQSQDQHHYRRNDYSDQQEYQQYQQEYQQYQQGNQQQDYSQEYQRYQQQYQAYQHGYQQEYQQDQQDQQECQQDQQDQQEYEQDQQEYQQDQQEYQQDQQEYKQDQQEYKQDQQEYKQDQQEYQQDQHKSNQQERPKSQRRVQE